MAYEEWLHRLTDDLKSSIIDLFRNNSMTTEINWSNEYSKQRKDRMQDAIDDYLNDDKVSARQTYEEMLFGIDDVINYHKKSMERAVELKSLMLGHREIDFIQE
jgi:predicted house-cleaning noncanonical NTP pyrophosphatase (MazG superfamily)